VDVQTSATAGGYLYAITTAETGAITAANATHPRRDILTIRVDDPQEDATGIPLIAVAYTAGTAAATPVVPATPARSMVLARIDTPCIWWRQPDRYLVGTSHRRRWWHCSCGR